MLRHGSAGWGIDFQGRGTGLSRTQEIRVVRLGQSWDRWPCGWEDGTCGCWSPTWDGLLLMSKKRVGRGGGENDFSNSRCWTLFLFFFLFFLGRGREWFQQFPLLNSFSFFFSFFWGGGERMISAMPSVVSCCVPPKHQRTWERERDGMSTNQIQGNWPVVANDLPHSGISLGIFSIYSFSHVWHSWNCLRDLELNPTWAVS